LDSQLTLDDIPVTPTLKDPAFIEVQFPVSKISKESYKERKANYGQTLTGLGKWWGRKPLALVRAALLGLLLPATDDPRKDLEVFLALMTADDEGMVRRLKSSMSVATVHECCTDSEKEAYFADTSGRVSWTPGLSTEEKTRVQRLAFLRMSYDTRLKYCLRPEEIDGPSPDAWNKINAHLGTSATSIPELLVELGMRRFGHPPGVADPFCGGGSVPFEAARLGCQAYGSDLSPVASLLTWGALHIVGGAPRISERAQKAQREAYDALCGFMAQTGLERSEDGWEADAFLYCVEAVDPRTGWVVPLVGSCMIGEGSRTIACLRSDLDTKRFNVEIKQGVSEAELRQARREGTWRNGIVCPVDAQGNWIPPERRIVSDIDDVRGRAGLRVWEKEDLVPRAEDALQERLFCIRWVNPETGERCFRAPTGKDLEREGRALDLLRKRLPEWQAKGYIPSRPIEPGSETDRLPRERGWTHWHHLFNPRQLLMAGFLAEYGAKLDEVEAVAALLALGKAVNWNSRLSGWISDAANEKGRDTFYNQALNPLVTYVSRGSAALETTVCARINSSPVPVSAAVKPMDARTVDWPADIWITDPGYADAINYEELSEFFLAWYEKRLPQLFPGWYTDSKRALAVRGRDEDFRRAMVECYKRFAELMPPNGFQIVMFTHQDAEVWSDLALILWAAGLQVTAAWTVATETVSAGIRQGNYVQGTVLLILRKRADNRRGDLSDIYPDLQSEVERQLEAMLALDDKDDPNFGDADYQLAAYAAALRILTSYASVDEIDVERELYRTRARGERSPLAGLIERAVKIASDFLVPDGLERATWKKMGPEERLYLKGIEVEAHGEYREGVYQEFARGFGAADYHQLLGSGRANEVRLKAPSEFRGRDLEGQGFAGSLLRKVLFAVWTTAEQEDLDPRSARDFLKQELTDYWERRSTILNLLDFLAGKPRASTMPHWERDVEAARLLRGSIEHDSV